MGLSCDLFEGRIVSTSFNAVAAATSDERFARMRAEAALFDDELRAWRERREPPRRADGQPFGVTVRSPVRDPEIWDTWFADNAARFDSDCRYRRGQPYSARALILCLLDESVPNSLRQLAYEELNVRFGCDVPFASDLRVSAQRAALQDLVTWLTPREAQLDRGRW